MKYNNFHKQHPEDLQKVYFISPLAKEVPGIYSVGYGFWSCDNQYKGYYSKHWREMTDVEIASFDYPDKFKAQMPIPPKRKYTKK